MKTFVERPESVGSASLLRSTHQPVGTSSCTSDSSFVRLRSFRDEQLKLRSPRTELPLQAWRRSSLRQIRLRATMSPTLARRRRRTQQRRTALPYCCPSGVNDSHDHSKPLANKLRRSLPRGLDLLASHQESGDLEKSVVEAVAAAATAASRTVTVTLNSDKEEQFADTKPSHTDLKTLAAEALDPGRLQKQQDNLSLRHKLVLAQSRLKQGPRLRLPAPAVGPEMVAINTVITKAFQKRPTETVVPGQTFRIQDTVGHFWDPAAFRGLPPKLLEILEETYLEEGREIAHVQALGKPSGSRLSAEGALQLGVSEERAAAWEEGSAIPFRMQPPQYARKPYSSVYTNLDTLLLVCNEILRLLKLGKVMPWRKKPWILSPTAIIIKSSPFEVDGMKKRIVYDLSASGVNICLDEHGEMSLPTILKLLQSMGKDYFMGKSDLKDMFYNFPVRKEDWTFLGFSHPVTGQYLVLPFYAMGLGCAPPHCQEFASSIRDIIKEEATRRRLGQDSLPGLEAVPRTAAAEGGLAAAQSELDFDSEVYIDDFIHLTKLLQQGLELFEIGAHVYKILGLVEKIIKREGPARVLTLLGFEFNSSTGLLRIPSAKAREIQALLRQVLQTATEGGAVPWSILSSLHGKLMWASTGIELGRSYLSAIRRPLDAVSSLLANRLQRSQFLIPVGEMPELIAQLRWWDVAVALNNGITTLFINELGMYSKWDWEGSFGDEVPSDVVQAFTDASSYGGGWSWGSERSSFKWSARERRHHINVLEAETVLRLLRADCNSLSHCKLLLWCDNLVTVRALRKGQSKSSLLTKIVREIRLICLRHHVSLCPVHIAGILNVEADGLSRGMISARCESWSLNSNIMARWHSHYHGFDVDVFCDPSGRGSQAPSFHSILDEPFSLSFVSKKVFAFPPLHLVSKFLEAAPKWNASVLVAVLPMAVAETAGLLGSLLHEYGSFQGIFTRPDGNTIQACPALGFSVGIFELSARIESQLCNSLVFDPPLDVAVPTLFELQLEDLHSFKGGILKRYHSSGRLAVSDAPQRYTQTIHTHRHGNPLTIHTYTPVDQGPGAETRFYQNTLNFTEYNVGLETNVDEIWCIWCGVCGHLDEFIDTHFFF
jgi:hypothetical protein